MVYDCFAFFNELDMLKLRLKIMSPLVDYFVIGEATHTFSGMPKELCFEKNKSMFAEFLPKIRYIVIDDSPVEYNTFERDGYQKNNLIRGLNDAADDDVIIFSDLDEIPNPIVVKEIIENFNPENVYHLAQRMFHGFFNNEEISEKLLSNTGEFPGVSKRKWLGTKIFAIRNIPERGLTWVREHDVKLPTSVRVDNGGWHFSYMGGSGEKDVSKRVKEKIIAAAHQEYNERHTLAEIADKAVLGKDFLGSEARFARVPIDESFPQYLRENLSEYEHLIMPPVSKFKVRFTKVTMLIKRFFRKIIMRIIRFIKTGKIRRDRQ
ncbi:MAG: glycosyl transferase GT17 family protein [Lachnospiraceae bacterium]|nr:glycosyl transferase GT17 family protein [Lachnospiraceae bacterium]